MNPMGYLSPRSLQGTAGRTVRALALAALALLPWGAAHAATITGTVRNEASAGIGNVDLDFIDLCTGDNIFLSGDKSAADGTFSVIVPNGIYDIHFTPPAGSTVAAGDLQGVEVGASASLGVITLHPGRLVSGTVLTPALGPAAGVDLKFVDRATSHRVYLSKSVTNAAGQYAIRVPPGAWDLDFRPPSTSAFADGERFGVVVGALDLSGLQDTLRAGFIVTGDVRDRNGNKIKNVDVDVFDSCTGSRIATAHDNTDVNGNYSIVVPTGTYLFNFDPPRCKALAASREPGVVISRNETVRTQTLAAAVLVSGIVHGSAGLPLADAKLKFFDAGAAGTPRQATAGDRTDAAGAFSILLPPGIFDIDIEPPAGVNDVVLHLAGVPVAAATDLGTVSLVAGVPLSGHVAGPGGRPVLNVNVNVVDAVTRVSQRLAHDDTDALGDFGVVVAPGTYDIQYDPPACTGLAPTSQNRRTVSAATILPPLDLVIGAHVVGTVVDAGALPVANVDLDLYPAGSAEKVYTPGDRTAADGSYDVVIPPGLYDIKYVPSSLTRLRPALRTSVDLSTTQTLPVLTLADGWLVSGLVRDASTSAPLAGVVVDFYPPGGTTPLLTSHHTTSATGAYNVSVDAGTWDLHFVPPAGTPYAPTWRYGVAVSGDLALADEPMVSLLGVDRPRPRGSLSLSAPWPNPSRGGLQLTLVAPEGGAELAAWDVTGRRVATLWRGSSAVPLTVRWTGSRGDGSASPPGLYYLRLAGPEGTMVSRSVLLLR